MFEIKRWELRDTSHGVLSRLKSQIENSGEIERIIVIGHADAIPSQRPDNYTLSELRAKAVRSWIVENLKIDEKRIEARGEGASRLIKTCGSNDDVELRLCNAANRRVEVKVITKLASQSM